MSTQGFPSWRPRDYLLERTYSCTSEGNVRERHLPQKRLVQKIPGRLIDEQSYLKVVLLSGVEQGGAA